VSVVASFLGIPVLVLPVFVDVVARIMRLLVEALLDQCRLLTSRRRFLVDTNLPLMSHGLGSLFCCHPSISGG
jgi:hypothetical protein